MQSAETTYPPEFPFRAGPWTTTADTYSTAYVVHAQVVRHAAHIRNIRVHVFDDYYFDLTHGGRTVGFWQHTPSSTSLAARKVSNSKDLTKKVLARAGVNVPEGRLFTALQSAKAWAYGQTLGLPIVVKPLVGSGGKGVTSDIQTRELFRAAWRSARRAGGDGKIVVERHVDGQDFRLFVVGGRMVAGIYRNPANIIGDGLSTVSELVERKNATRAPNPYLGTKPLVLTPMTLRTLRDFGLAPDSVVEAGRQVFFHPVANVRRGGDSIDISDQVHPGFAEIAVRATQALPGAIHSGVDLICKDVSAPPSSQTWTVCEINTCPDIALHHFPVDGMPRDVAGLLVEELFPGVEILPPSAWRKRKATIRGQVTGVGFRAWVRRRALQRGLSGWIRNVADDEVQALFCGAPTAVDEMVALCRDGPNAAKVAGVDAADWSGEIPTGFVIQ